MDFRTQVMAYIHKHKLISDGDQLLVACSGGADSVALLTFLNKQKDELGIALGCIHANHGLRGKESDGDEQFVEELCNDLGIPFYRKMLPINRILENEGGNLQHVCRVERYRFFEEIMSEHGYNKLAVAHHADDQVESVFMGLARGTRANGMYATRSFSKGELIRPFLSVARNQIELFLSEQQYTYREDSSNKKDTYTRNRFRHQIVPLIQEENPNVAAMVGKWTEQQQLEDVFLQRLAEAELEEAILHRSGRLISIDLGKFQGIPLALQRRAVLLLLNYLYPNENLWLSHSLVDQILVQCQKSDGSNEIHLPKGCKAVRNYMEMHFSFEDEVSTAPDFPIMLFIGEWTSIGFGIRIRLSERGNAVESSGSWYASLQESELPLRVRARKPGDRVLLKGMEGSKRLSRLLIDEKVPLHIRDSVQLIETQQGEVIGVPGMRLGARFTKQPHDGWTHMLSIEKESD